MPDSLGSEDPLSAYNKASRARLAQADRLLDAVTVEPGQVDRQISEIVDMAGEGFSGSASTGKLSRPGGAGRQVSGQRSSTLSVQALSARVNEPCQTSNADQGGNLMNHGATYKMRAGVLLRHHALLLVGLLLAAALTTACAGCEPTCTGGSAAYKGRCLPQVTVHYLECIDDKGLSYDYGVSVSATLPAVADSTFSVAYNQSKKEDSTVALQIVHDCFTLAEENATSRTDRGTAQHYARQATRYIHVLQRRLPAIELDPSGTLNCGSADVGAQVTCNVTIKSTGIAALRITGVEVAGTNGDDFTADDECVGQSPLDPGQSCVMTVQFTPSAPGELNATLVIHQNIPAPDYGTSLHLVGTATSPPQVDTFIVMVDASAAAGGVTSNLPGLACRDTCNWPIDDGTDITLTATYDQGSGQVSWEGCDTESGDSCTVHLTSNHTVIAHILPPIG
jgi:hypothetical protein